MHNNGNGFTLIEMLVVIAIISVLVALLMPALMKANNTAKLISCANNMRQIGSALHSYANDYRNFLYLAQPSYWYDNWAVYPEKESYLHRIGPKHGYVKDGKIYDCPGNKISSKIKSTAGWGEYSSRDANSKYEYPYYWTGTGYFRMHTLVKGKSHLVKDKYSWIPAPFHSGNFYNIIFIDLHLKVYQDIENTLNKEGYNYNKCNDIIDSNW